ncbi:MAG: aspartoacylase [Winogradskyella sp.]|nr:succinylglutamate desuccinylase/aspartoacylase family protein [Winogradskyella sp.]NNC45109.1 aspartoacylase [Winogradskyella sp.]NNF85275.1 aspartoacylase [Winogradskyella sp.]
MQATQATSQNSSKSSTSRIIHYIKGDKPGPIIIFFGGLHGNEPAGVYALKNVLTKITAKDLRGEVYGLFGNIEALQKGKRFINEDLNRIWTTDRVDKLYETNESNSEIREQKALNFLISEILSHATQPIYFIDLHTTSSKTLPFVTINDALINRKFASRFPVPIVLGIEEYLEGPLLTYLNKLGYVSLGFESGQHNDPNAVLNFEAFIKLVLHEAGSFIDAPEATIAEATNTLKIASKYCNHVFEVIYKYHIKPDEQFIMHPGFISFEKIKKGQILASSNGEIIKSQHNATLFMPLYQKTGNDGFFIIKKIRPFYLKLSAFLRKIKADNLLVMLPGISWYKKDEGVLRANLKITRYLAKSIFHLFGYRNKQVSGNYVLLYNRERTTQKDLYKHLDWY